jgi:transcriptional regulator with XRE-family HTH domain
LPKSIHSSEYDGLKRLLRDARLEKGLTQSELAARLEVTQSRVSKVEQGERRLDLVELQEWCSALGISLVSFVRRFQSGIGKN